MPLTVITKQESENYFLHKAGEIDSLSPIEVMLSVVSNDYSDVFEITGLSGVLLQLQIYQEKLRTRSSPVMFIDLVFSDDQHREFVKSDIYFAFSSEINYRTFTG